MKTEKNRPMKWKQNTFSYYGVLFMHLIILVLWLVLLLFIPVRNKDEWEGFVFSLLAVEGLLFCCSPVAHRVVVTDDKTISEKWLCFVFIRMEIVQIADCGVCTYLNGNQARQFAFVSAKPLSDSEIMQYDSMGFFRRIAHQGQFIAIDYPQKGLDEWLKTIAEKNGILCRECRI